MITILCLYNNKDLLNNYLIKSLRNQTVKYEIFLINNTIGEFKSAAKALNSYGKKAKGKYIMFVHQDVDLTSNSWLEDVEKMLDTLPSLGVAGVAGKREDVNGVITNIHHGVPPKLAGQINVKNPIEVQTLDGCLVLIPKSVFNLLKFDETTCNGFFYYAEDYCLSIKKHGYNVYVIPMFIYHVSTGSFSKDHYLTLEKLVKKHRICYKNITTTTGNWSTRYPFIIQGFRKNLMREYSKYVDSKTRKKLQQR